MHAIEVRPQRHIRNPLRDSISSIQGIATIACDSGQLSSISYQGYVLPLEPPCARAERGFACSFLGAVGNAPRSGSRLNHDGCGPPHAGIECPVSCFLPLRSSLREMNSRGPGLVVSPLLLCQTHRRRGSLASCGSDEESPSYHRQLCASIQVSIQRSDPIVKR